MEMEPRHKRPRILRVLAWGSFVLLCLGWSCLLLTPWGGASDLPYKLFWLTQFGAFVVGLSSCERLGGICAALAALIMIGMIAWGSAMAAAG